MRASGTESEKEKEQGETRAGEDCGDDVVGVGSATAASKTCTLIAAPSTIANTDIALNFAGYSIKSRRG